jgi:hypothetical protein
MAKMSVQLKKRLAYILHGVDVVRQVDRCATVLVVAGQSISTFDIQALGGGNELVSLP